MIRAVHHVGISTPNLARLRSFYCDLLGFTELSHITWQPGEAQIDKFMALSVGPSIPSAPSSRSSGTAASTSWTTTAQP